MDPLSSSLSTGSPLDTPRPVPGSPPVTTRASSSPSPFMSPAPLPDPASYGDPDGFIFVLTDGNGFIYTTTVYSTRNPSLPTSTPASNLNVTNATGLSAVIAGVGGGVGLLLLLAGVAWFVRVRRAKRRAGKSVITDRKFYPDRYNQTVTSNRHSEYNEIEPGPVVVQPPPPPPLPLSERASLYQGHVPFPQAHGNWARDPLPDGVLKDTPPLTRHRVPYPSTPPQPASDRYTMLPSRSTTSSNTPTTPFRFTPNLPPHHPRHSRYSPSTHRRHHSHHSYHNRPQNQDQDVTNNPYFPSTPFQNQNPSPSPSPMRVARRNTILVSPPMSPSAFSFLSSPPSDLQATRAETTTVTLTSRPSIGRSTFSSADPLVVANETTTVTRMMVTNPDSDVDAETDTEPDESGRSRSRSGGSPSATDIIRLYERDRDRDTSPTNSVMREMDAPTEPIPTSTKSG